MKVIKKAAPAVLSKGNGCWRKADRADVNSYLVNKVFFILPYEDQFQTNSNQVHFDNDRANLKCLPIQKFLKTEIGKQFNFIKDRKILASESGFDGFYMALLERKE